MTDEEKTKSAQKVYDAVLNAFPNLRQLMIDSQEMARQKGYVETFLGRRRHIPEMQLPEFEFKAMPGYVNPDLDMLDISTMDNQSEIPERIVKQLQKEFSEYKYFGQVVKRTKALAEEKIRVVNNRSKINDGSRQCVNCVDAETLILTDRGWRSIEDIEVGDAIVSFDKFSERLVADTILDIHTKKSMKDLRMIHITSTDGSIDAMCTNNHRWLIHNGSEYKFVSTNMLERMSRESYSAWNLLAVNVNSESDMTFTDVCISDLKYSVELKDMCWCVTTNTETWIAKRHHSVYVTGNSRIQGGAADMTKIAILLIESSDEWKSIGGRLVNAVHDELIAEVPIHKYEEGGKILSELMCKAADFMPFPISCDVETTCRWYGVSYPCPYPKPESLNNMTTEEIKWVQYCLSDLEYDIPILKDENGEKPRGDAARGINGVVTEEFEFAIDNYVADNRVTREQFIEHIHDKTFYGIV